MVRRKRLKKVKNIPAEAIDKIGSGGMVVVCQRCGRETPTGRRWRCKHCRADLLSV